MRCLSLWQPWASALIAGTKRFETRGWPCPPSAFGKELAIHAAKRPPRLAEIGEDFEECCEPITGHAWTDLPLGCVLGIVRPTRCYRTGELVGLEGYPTDFGAHGEGIGEMETMLGNYAPGRYAWRVEVLERFETPIPAKGMQGIWEWREPPRANAQTGSAREPGAPCATLVAGTQAPVVLDADSVATLRDALGEATGPLGWNNFAHAPMADLFDGREAVYERLVASGHMARTGTTDRGRAMCYRVTDLGVAAAKAGGA